MNEANFPIDKTDEWESRQDVAKQAMIPDNLKDFSHHFADMDPLFRQIILNRIATAEVRAEKAEADAQRLYEALKEIHQQVKNGRLRYFGDSTGYTPQFSSEQVDYWDAAIAAHEETK